MSGIKKNRNKRITGQFPRTNDLPSQSSKYWAKEKDRYIRQLLINDIEELTGRELVVYFSQLNEGINHTDADDLSEIIEGVESPNIDLLIQTPGGMVDAVEKIISVLQQRLDSYRVIVPSWAKSGGTVIAISSEKIFLGVNSELGPIDPQMFVPDIGMVPCEIIAEAEDQPDAVKKLARMAVDRMTGLAKKYLIAGMMKGKSETELELAIKRISSPQSYGSHGAVIDFSEAEDVGLTVEWLKPEEELWRRIWLLYCLYDYDTKDKGLGKVLEGSKNSIARLSSY